MVWRGKIYLVLTHEGGRGVKQKRVLAYKGKGVDVEVCNNVGGLNGIQMIASVMYYGESFKSGILNNGFKVNYIL